MIQLLRNVRVFREGAWRLSELLIADRRIAGVGDRIRCEFDGLTVTDGGGLLAVPGLIDQHVHITGGGGEGGFDTQVPPLRATDAVRAGVTTLVGLLGTDGVTRSVENLVAKTKALRAFGLTAYCLTGSYRCPGPTLTGSVLKDIVFIEEIIGVKAAVSDHRSSNMTLPMLTQLASDARLGGLLSGKAGIVHLHTGRGKGQLDLLFDLLEHTDVPISVLRPTHVESKYDAALRFARKGGWIDFTCDPKDPEALGALVVQALEEAPAERVTLSTDSNGSLPVWNDRGELEGMDMGCIAALPETLKAMVRLGCPLERALLPVTENPARALGLWPSKGTLDAGSDGDITLLDDSLTVRGVYARGRRMLWDGVPEVRENFAD